MPQEIERITIVTIELQLLECERDTALMVVDEAFKNKLFTGEKVKVVSIESTTIDKV